MEMGKLWHVVLHMYMRFGKVSVSLLQIYYVVYDPFSNRMTQIAPFSKYEVFFPFKVPPTCFSNHQSDVT